MRLETTPGLPKRSALRCGPLHRFTFADNLGFSHRHAAAAADWVRTTWPFWNASGGADHLLWLSGDQASA